MLLSVLPQLRARQHNIPSFTVEDSFSQGPPQMAGPDVQLGNSATSSNNHVEALDWLRTRVPAAGRLIVPLNYGNARYARAVADAVLEGKANTTNEMVQAAGTEGDEFVEVREEA